MPTYIHQYIRCEAGDEGGQLIGWYVQSQSKYILFKINKRNMIYLSNLYKSEMYLYQCAVHHIPETKQTTTKMKRKKTTKF